MLHDGPAELLEMMVPFVRDGTAAGEHVLLLGERDFVDAVVAEVPEVDPVHVLAERHGQRFPGRELHRAQRALAQLDDTGRRVRIVNQMPPMTAQQWLGWRRYEAAANVALAPYPAWGKCAHDLAHLDPRWLDELRASHPSVHTATVDGSNPGYDERADDTQGFFDVPRHPVEATEPTLTLVGPTAAAARRAVGGIAAASGLSPTARECAILATSETVTNASVHGLPPVRLRAWSAPGRVTVAVSDGGRGPHPSWACSPSCPRARPAGACGWSTS
ncbi:sensor histidine kinase [Cellulomonas sp. ATA003]|uniref:sensor histidine kinase n=1 Tax=Cellulomonas sp. ATA003 TaxID=3073064 RepID=UPI002873DBB2|nr:sensor histidine kinase [Cellulomonas sp. ATA003]WNB87043.1 sensor histidine kinase [Cellulomonas sp. ATA003]